MNALRSVVYFGWIYFAMAVIGLGAMPLAALWRPASRWAERAWCTVAAASLPLAGIRVRIHGLDRIPTGAALIAGKHHAQLDTILPFTLLRDPAMVLKQELLSVPVFGWYARRSGHIAVDREASAAALRGMLKAARAASAAGRQIVIFPEGTRVRPGARAGYKPGVAALYKNLDLPCVPLALNTGLCWPAKGWVLTPGDVELRFLEPIPPGLPREAFMAELERRIETESDAMLPPALRPPQAASTSAGAA